MSKTVSFVCDDVTTQLFIQILTKLENAGVNNHTRKIRVGGDEYVFIGGCDTVKDITVDDIFYSTMSPSEQRDLEILRATILNPAPAPVVVPLIPVTPTVSTPDADGDANDSLLDSADASAVKDVVKGKVDKGEMFTAFDITKELKASGRRVYHSNVKPIVHALFNNGDMQGYNRSLISVSGAPVQPFLYHPCGADTSTYKV